MWPEPDSKSAALYERARRVFAGGSTRLQVWAEPFPVYAATGAGAYVTDVDGTRRLDLTNNYASLIHGHAHPAVIEAVTARIADGTCFALPTETEVALAELLCQRVTRFEAVRFCNTGSEAVMLAMKAARAKTGRPKIAKVEGAYHGMYDYAEVSLDSTPDNWGNAPRAVPFATGTPRGVLDDVVVLPFNDVATSERILRAHAGELAAVLLDPVPGMCGMITASPEFLAMLRGVTREIGALLIFDEVIAFRLAYHGAQARFGGEPDLTTLGKIIGGGFPVGAVAGTSDAMAVFDQTAGKPLMPASGTFTANPVSMTAGLVTMQLLTPECYDRLEALGEHARAGIAAAFAASGYPGQVTGVGAMFLLHPHTRPVTDYRATYRRPDDALALKALHRALLQAGYILSPTGAGFLSSVMTEADLDGFAAALTRCLGDLAAAARGRRSCPKQANSHNATRLLG